MAAEPIKSLEFHYTVIQFLIDLYHSESQENKKLCCCTANLSLNSRLAEACRAKTKLFIPQDSTWPPSDKCL